MKTPSRPISHRAFTLVELMVVVAIVAAMATLAWSGSRRLITAARVTNSASNLRSLAIANHTYLADHGVYCPASDQSTNRRWHGTRKSTTSPFDPTQGFLSPYLGKSAQTVTCPLFRAMVDDSSSFESGTGGYGYNAHYIGGLPDGSFDRSTRIQISQKAANVPNPGRTVMFTTTAYARASGLQEYPFCEPPFWPHGGRPSPSVHFRANGKAIVAWCDGSVSTESMTDATAGDNPHGGDAEKWSLGWFGPEEDNGWWNPAFR
jgi:prepilin-type N-terminal cleavage/methylation domain-containing protein/prepilin-type processing-associated H-X9-DG protein